MANEENIGINFVNIPIEIFSNKELSANEKILYGYLSIFKKQCCFQSNEALAEMIGVSENTITNALKHLSDLEYIFIEFLNGNSAKRRIYVILDNPKKTKYLISKGLLGGFPQAHKNCEGNKNCEEAHKNCDHKIIKENKNIEDSASAFEMPSRASENKKFVGRNELLKQEYAF